MGEFYGRAEELAGLSALTQKSTASLVAVTGRRRNGKSRLIEEFARSSRGYRFLALSGLPVLAPLASVVHSHPLARKALMSAFAANEVDDLQNGCKLLRHKTLSPCWQQ